MDDLLHLTGFQAAHAVWSVSDPGSGDLIPMVAWDTKHMERWVGLENPKEHFFEKWLPAHPEVTRAVCAYDGFLTLPALPRIDTIFVEAIERAAGLHVTFGIPYRPAHTPPGFAVFRPKLLLLEGIPTHAVGPLMDRFWAGVDSHTEAARAWNAALDQSM